MKLIATDVKVKIVDSVRTRWIFFFFFLPLAEKTNTKVREMFSDIFLTLLMQLLT